MKILMKILLINPGSFEDIESKMIRELPYLLSKAFFAPHALAAIAALTSNDYDVEIHDEYMHGPVDTKIQINTFDIVGISITTNQLDRSLTIAGLLKKWHPKTLVVVGGIGVEFILSKDRPAIDVVFQGEAENTWPRFLEDFKKGSHQKMYKSVLKPDMTKTPPPRWELLGKELASYNAVSVQTTRGCPFDCSFCDVIYTYGRKPRSKTIDQVLDEVKKLQAMNVSMIFFADDNFAGNKNYTRELLKKLVVLNNSFKRPLGFLTQLDITIAQDHELLALLADCNFYVVMIGIESVNEGSLKDMNKQQNMRISVSQAVAAIQSYGIIVLAHMIVGADSDGPDVFEKTAGFLKEANIVQHFCHPLTAPPGTKMWYELKRQGRIISMDHAQVSDKLDIISNIIPKQMSRVELFNGLADYWEKAVDPGKFTGRAIAFVHGITRKPQVKNPGIAELWKMRNLLMGVFTFYLFKVSREHRKAFFTILKRSKNKLSYLMPKITYLYTFFFMDYKRSMHDAGIVRSHAAWELEHPEAITVDSRLIPVSQTIRSHAPVLFSAAYHRVREKIYSKELLYETVVRALIDYNDRFGEGLTTFDEFQKEYLNTSCDRIMNSMTLSPVENLFNPLPVDPPADFTREILDSLDNAIRYKNMAGG
jgi:radical SAM superfamily enzyme YgiQ (UPF0313 family)